MAKVKLLDPSDPRRRLDPYELIGEIATGGMATVFLARRSGAGGFQRFVAIKRLHPHLQNEPEFVEMFLDEARLAAQIHHPNVVPILEVGESESGYFLVMEYVEGDTLSRVVARTMSLGQLPPRHVVVRMVLDSLAGLHAAHELKDDRGHLLGLVHRDVSPQNVLVGVDGTARITDFGVARASSRLTSTANGKLKGKLAYMAPEQTRGDELDRRTDLFAMGIILWEVLCARRLFKADTEAATLQRILVAPVQPPSEILSSIPKAFDAVVLRSLDRDPSRRFQTAEEMGEALEAAARESASSSVTDLGVASPREVASFVQQVLGSEIGAQRESVRAWLAQSDSGQPVVIQGGIPSTRTPHRSSFPPQKPPSQPPSARAEGPRYEVPPDITMRFSLEAQARPELPRPEPPPQRASDPPPGPSGPAKRSQPRTLIGQGPSGGPSEGPISATMAGPPPVMRDDVGDGASTSVDPPRHTDDVGDDAETAAHAGVARPVVLQPAIKTARGLQAEPILAEARERAAANSSLVSAVKTPRMPMPADDFPRDAKVQISSRPPPAPSEPPSAVVASSARSLPRTLVSGVAEVSAGGYTPGSMTLPSDSIPPAPRYESSLDPTMVHEAPKSGLAKYFILFAAVFMICATALLLMKSPPDERRAAEASTATSKPASTGTSAPATEPITTATAEPPLATSGTTIDVASLPESSAPRPTGGTGGRLVRPATADPYEPTPPDKPKPPPTAKPGGDDLSNPYR